MSSTAVLLVDDEPDIRCVVAAKLRAAGYTVETASDGPEACRRMAESPPHVVLLDVMMPGMSGIEVCRWVRSQPAVQHAYVIFLTAKSQVSDRVSGLDAGADDYVVKPFDLNELLARVRAGERHYTNVCALKEQAVRDALTGLYSKQVFWAFLEKEFHRAQRYAYALAIVVIDMDNLKAINDDRGHLAGDAAIQAVGRVLEGSRRGSDVAVRFGGDEFVLLLPQTDSAGAQIVAERIRQGVEHAPVEHPEGAFPLTVSLGLASTDRCPVHTPEELFELADAACRDAKQGGRNRVRFCRDAAEVAGRTS
ncbi:MAG: diguanylate cyclase [Planctomycetota bacterium]|nr:diguanylate cyclase [Planctomycetota bacterium]